MLFISSVGMLLADLMVAASFMIDGGAPLTITGTAQRLIWLVDGARRCLRSV